MFEGHVNASVLRFEIVDFIKAIKVPSGGWGIAGVADVPTTEISVSQSGKKSITSIYALWISPDGTGSGLSLANPAALFCISQSGTLVAGKVVLDSPTPPPDLSIEYCHLPDGSYVEEWAYFYRASKAGIIWPSGIPSPTGRCMSVASKPFTSLLRTAGSKQWLLPTGSMASLTWRPVLPDEIACKR